MSGMRKGLSAGDFNCKRRWEIMNNLSINAIKALCDKYAEKTRSTYEIKHSKSTSSLYIVFYLAEQGNKFTIRVSDHKPDRRKYKGATINTRKNALKKIDRLIRCKLRKHLSLRVRQIIDKM